jgi:3',5'-cyclic AMP phosphodiesterase CpdA
MAKKFSCKSYAIALGIVLLLPLWSVSENHLANLKASALPDENSLPSMKAMTIAGDPSQEMGFAWNTVNYTDSDLQVVPASIGDFTSSEVLSFTGATTVSKAAGDNFIHKAFAKNLAPNTAYDYRYGDKELNLWAASGSFTTANPASTSLEFLHLSDPQGWEESHYVNYTSLLENATKESKASFIALTGDIVNNDWAGYAPTLQQWKWALDTPYSILKNYPLAPVAGNHEAANNDFASRFALATPESDKGLTGDYYSFDYGPAHFTAINTNDTTKTDPATGLGDDQLSWIKTDLEASKAKKWKIVLLHKGLFDAGAHCSNLAGDNDYDIPLIRQQLAPLFTQYSIDLVLQGHDHLYSRSYPTIAKQEGTTYSYSIDPSYSQNNATVDGNSIEMMQNLTGTLYLTTGSASGSKYYDVVSYDDSIIHIEKAANTSSKVYTDIQIDGDKLVAQTYKVSSGVKTFFTGFGIDKAPVTPTPTSSSSSSSSTSATGNNGSSIGIILGSVFGGIALVGVAVLVVILIKKKKAKEA